MLAEFKVLPVTCFMFAVVVDGQQAIFDCRIAIVSMVEQLKVVLVCLQLAESEYAQEQKG